ncbi:hypothetical protein AGMMS49991_08230 [Spirochaetia bacterium]|nr:hypothetical protein AGMMS49991_08230 [Spirochaetia bacterium]
MLVNGCDCSIVIKTAYRGMGVPYSGETIREAVSLLQEQAAIEGNGSCGAIRIITGVTGCVITPLTIGTAPLLLYLAFGSIGLPVFVSETRNIYQYHIDLVPMEGGAWFDLVQDRGGERRLFEGCRVKGFELRFQRGEAVYLKLDVCGEIAPVVYPYSEIPATEGRERFNSDFVTYRINGIEYENIYGITLSAKRGGGTKTELWIKRALQQGGDLPGIIEELTITARLLTDKYEYRNFGTFRITLKKLVLISDKTAIDCADGVIGPLRYYVAGSVCSEVFTSTGETIA